VLTRDVVSKQKFKYNLSKKEKTQISKGCHCFGPPCIWIVHCVSKQHPNIFDCKLKTNYQILIIFGMNIPDTTCHQMTIQFYTSPNVCFCTTWGKHNQRNAINNFWQKYRMRCDCLINITHKNTFCSHFWHFGWQFIQLSIFNCLQ